MYSKRKIGYDGETIASNYLLKENYNIIERNFRCPIGEIDIICEKDNTYIFIEVKTRKSLKYGFPAESVNYYKRQKITNIAKWYLVKNNINNKMCRFDIIEIYFENKNYKINHIINAWIEGQ